MRVKLRALLNSRGITQAELLDNSKKVMSVSFC